MGLRALQLQKFNLGRNHIAKCLPFLYANFYFTIYAVIIKHSPKLFYVLSYG